MNATPFFAGLLSTALLLTISFVIVFGGKAFLVFFGFLPERKPKPPAPKKRRRPPTGKTLYIDPDGVSKILVRKDDRAP